ncbi:MAG: hypothetical protein ABI603_09380 [Acidobacteriota bacterium]
MTLALRQSLASIVVFSGLLLMLVSVDERVRERFENLVSGYGVSSWSARAGDLADALASALRHQSIENAPLLVFAVVGAVLVVFMVRA